MRINGGCGALRSGKRDAAISATNGTLHDPTGTGQLTYVAVPIGDLLPGRWTLDVRVSTGTVESFSVLDNEGETFANGSGSGSQSLTFNIADLHQDDEIPAALIGYTSTPATISYSGQTPASPSGARRAVGGRASIASACAIAIAVAAIMM